jgi:hypothetical protein
MSNFEWRSPETYAELQTAEAADCAGECGRRNSHCREDYRTPWNSEAVAAMDGISRERCDSFMSSVNDVPTRDIFRRFPVESATIRYAVVGGNCSNVAMIIVTGQIGRRVFNGRRGPSRMQRVHLIALSPGAVEIADGWVCLEA